MIICGIKTTHDGAIALIDNGELVFSYEMEKLENNLRFTRFCLSIDEISKIFNSYGYDIEKIDKWVLDGWGDEPLGSNYTLKDVEFLFKGKKVDIELAAYGNLVKDKTNILAARSFTLPHVNFSYDSYLHVTSHVFSSYCTSPFAREKNDSFILVWDGGMPPQLFYYSYEKNKVLSLGSLMYLFGSIYADFPHEFEPFCNSPKQLLSTAGKMMAYIALGEAKESIIRAYNEIYEKITKGYVKENIEPVDVENLTKEFTHLAKEYSDLNQTRHADMLASLHSFLEERLLTTLGELIGKFPDFTKNLCFAGGCALNIKWNSALRSSKIFDSVWIPPFPNDSGSAIGAACCAMISNSDLRSLVWNVYSGPKFISAPPITERFKAFTCSLKDLALIIHETNTPILFLNGRAELGPRALGNRSILAAPVSIDMKNTLNDIKMREYYRPIAPICLEEDAPEVFFPGNPDPFMLFQHMVKDDWKDKVPAIVHLDNSSRLQTVNRKENKLIYELLSHYKKLSGIPLLCNTSANLKGVGFFPDLETPMKWGHINYIWNAGILYTADASFAQHALEEQETTNLPSELV